ncbi:hypothetical protein BJF92_20740 [Rhizobium rhizosphaerae]|uniref:Uncharacterized protein n=1 Tax=Xaviernesmea rhizosphaerae TaxID=1672749 RepID=A0A1Q9ACW1_9HYPH|nr:hypothetical protein [Xaviernesmea rhizosphaerae]OLP52751.1 hypothetical protein BJF92_20740 [Xaviernesmea rhizosphaerae]OQP83612.1 hypothetical protein BTR14_22135 [Xaviernesmea rhizosphaerae]
MTVKPHATEKHNFRIAAADMEQGDGKSLSPIARRRLPAFSIGQKRVAIFQIRLTRLDVDVFVFPMSLSQNQ